MRWKSKKSKVERLTNWHRWFAWHPVKVNELNDQTTVWLEFVHRKGDRWYWYNFLSNEKDFWIWEYRFLPTASETIGKEVEHARKEFQENRFIEKTLEIESRKSNPEK